MINIIWFAMLACGIAAAAIQGDIQTVTRATVSGAEEAVKTALGLIGIIAFWSGLMKIAEDAGLIKVLARLIRPWPGFCSRKYLPIIQPWALSS